ncbi:YncE family protein [Rhizomicrobium electricum]|uniref:YVTN family beta-propeller domain-containing protein n=1 Tax=Rhizomicrobium electricum TaxID=480070 RepID=A0ABP3QA28_9PROT|nr:YncE family protein [Rhizomicrobium electricum]NIJ46690.1 DNA-binding beta-propeller fold protein YncE [Rhizomicrobium electricum]
MRIAKCLAFTALVAFALSPSFAQSLSYRVVKEVALDAPDRWDYVSYDAAQDRVFVAHSDRVTVVDNKTGTVVGHVLGTNGGSHGIAFANGKGYTDDGKAGTVLVFDLKTLKVLKTIKAEPDADGIVYDPVSGHILVIDGDSAKITAIDPRTDTVVATVDAGGGLEFGVSGENGKFYVDGAEKGEIVRIDVKTNKADAHWPMKGCIKPHGLAIDRAAMRLFASCANKVMTVVDAANGTLLASLPIGEGTDFAVFDPVRKWAFSANRDGTLSVIAEKDANTFVALPPVKTAYGARTMAIDPKTGRLFLVTGDFEENPSAADMRHRYTLKPGSAKLLMLDPAAP